LTELELPTKKFVNNPTAKVQKEGKESIKQDCLQIHFGQL
jgi:hypothetical protein